VADVALNFPFKADMRRQFEDWTIGIIAEQLENGDNPNIAPPPISMRILKPLLVQWAFNSWQRIAESAEGSLLIQKGYRKCIKDFADPFDPKVQEAAVAKAVESTLRVYDEDHKGKPDEPESDDDDNISDEVDDDDDEKDDVLDVMAKRVEGTRKSTRKRKQIHTSEMVLCSDQIAFSSDEE
jgi:hypothetical protein